jgi:hypothetical protein
MVCIVFKCARELERGPAWAARKQAGRMVVMCIICFDFPALHCMWYACGCGLQVNYKNVMKQYNLGPNGGILTSLNLFATRFDQVGLDITCLQKLRRISLDCILLPVNEAARLILACCCTGARQPHVGAGLMKHLCQGYVDWKVHSRSLAKCGRVKVSDCFTRPCSRFPYCELLCQPESACADQFA